MAQHDGVIDDQDGLSFLSDLNSFIAAIISNNSGASAPSTTYAHQFWADTSAGKLKKRNAANTAWVVYGDLDVDGLGIGLSSAPIFSTVNVDDDPYDATTWNSNFEVPTKNAVRDKIQAILSAILNSTNDSTYASTSSTDPISPQWFNGKLASTRFTSTAQTITTAGALTIPHGLGSTPKFISYDLICTSAEAGYSIGEVLDINAFFDANARPTAVWKDATNIYVRFNNNTNVFLCGHKTSGALTSLTNSSWNLVINAML